MALFSAVRPRTVQVSSTTNLLLSQFGYRETRNMGGSPMFRPASCIRCTLSSKDVSAPLVRAGHVRSENCQICHSNRASYNNKLSTVTVSILFAKNSFAGVFALFTYRWKIYRSKISCFVWSFVNGMLKNVRRGNDFFHGSGNVHFFT